MSKVRQKIDGVKAFFTDVVVEMKKSTWPTRQELVESTVVVIISVVLLSLFVWVSDVVLERVLKLLV